MDILQTKEDISELLHKINSGTETETDLNSDSVVLSSLEGDETNVMMAADSPNHSCEFNVQDDSNTLSDQGGTFRSNVHYENEPQENTTLDCLPDQCAQNSLDVGVEFDFFDICADQQQQVLQKQNDVNCMFDLGHICTQDSQPKHRREPAAPTKLPTEETRDKRAGNNRKNGNTKNPIFPQVGSK